MKARTIRVGVLLAVCAVACGLLAGCDQAEKAMEKTDLGASAELTKLVGQATNLLGDIKDVDSAKAALPKLKDLDLDLGQLVTKFNEMSPDQKSKLTGAVTKVMPQLEGAVEKVSGMPGVGAIVGPTLKSLQEKFTKLT